MKAQIRLHVQVNQDLRCPLYSKVSSDILGISDSSYQTAMLV